MIARDLCGLEHFPTNLDHQDGADSGLARGARPAAMQRNVPPKRSGSQRCAGPKIDPAMELCGCLGGGQWCPGTESQKTFNQLSWNNIPRKNKAQSIKDTISLRFIPGSVPVCVEKLLNSDEWSAIGPLSHVTPIHDGQRRLSDHGV